MRFTTAYLEASKNPVHKELLFLLTQGNPTGKPIREDDKNGKVVRS